LQDWLGDAQYGSEHLVRYSVRARDDKWFEDPRKKTPKDDVIHFPCVWALNQQQEELTRQTGIVRDALAHRSIIFPTSKYNAGCDCVGLMDEVSGGAEGVGTVLILVESKYCTYTADTLSDTLSNKAHLALYGVLHKTFPKGKTVKHVAFVAVIAGAVDPTCVYRMDYKSSQRTWQSTLKDAIDKLFSKHHITVSLHINAGVEGCRRLLTPVVYHLVPDNEFHVACTDNVPKLTEVDENNLFPSGSDS
jgi:hypothetical protein